MTFDSTKKPIRIIPRLDIKGPNLVKGIHLEGLRVLGQPHDFAKYYYENGADELFFQDVVASLYGRNSMSEIIQKTANEIFIPLTVGGGIRTIDDINNVLRCGADKVAINTAAIGDKEFIRKASEKFGSSTIVVAIEVIQETDGRFQAYTDNGREYTGIDAIEWSEEVVELGAGELIITSVDREGTGKGLDLSLLETIAEKIDVPLIAHGGVGKINHVTDLFNKTQVDACAIASALHYNLLQQNKVQREVDCHEGNVEFLKKNISFKNIDLFEINEIKSELETHNFLVRN
jgi:cyclase